MPETDVFAYKESGLDRFLFAEIGIEKNGSSLTILSALARKGDDPWEKAAQWASAPRSKVIEWLAADIAGASLVTDPIDDAHATAARLVQLLPSPRQWGPEARKAGWIPFLQWGCVILLAGSIAIALAVTAAGSLHPNSLAGHGDKPSPALSSVAAG